MSARRCQQQVGRVEGARAGCEDAERRANNGREQWHHYHDNLLGRLCMKQHHHRVHKNQLYSFGSYFQSIYRIDQQNNQHNFRGGKPPLGKANKTLEDFLEDSMKQRYTNRLHNFDTNLDQEFSYAFQQHKSCT